MSDTITPAPKAADILHGQSKSRDFTTIALLFFLSVCPYLLGLGFYSDDWRFLGVLENSGRDNLLEEYRFFRDNDAWVRYRPMQILLLSALHRAFGVSPLGYHLTNQIFLLLAGGLLYLALLELGFPRLLAFGSAVFYLTMPHFSTVHFWIATIQVSFSAACYLLSLYAALRILRPGRISRWFWAATSLVALLASALSYEIFGPFFLLNILLVGFFWKRKTAAEEANKSRRAVWVWSLSSLACLALLGIKSAGSSGRVYRPPLAEQLSYVRDVLFAAADIHADDFGLRLGRTVWYVLRDNFSAPNLLLALLVGTLAGLYLFLSGRRDRRKPLPNLRVLTGILLAGGVLLMLGYSVFLVFATTQIGISAAGVSNRSGTAAGLGIAIAWSALVGLLGRTMFGGRRIAAASSVVLALVVGSFVLVKNTIADYWVAAARKQETIFAAVRRAFPALPHGSALLLDQVCPYAGPAPVLHGFWDVGGRLQVEYRDPSLRGDLTYRILHADDSRLRTGIYHYRNEYPFGATLFLYRLEDDVTLVLDSAATAQRELRHSLPAPRAGCPPAIDGIGVPIF